MSRSSVLVLGVLLLSIHAIALPAFAISASFSNGEDSTTSNFLAGKSDSIRESVTLGAATLADSWYYYKGSSSTRGDLPTIDKWYCSSSGKYCIHNYATGYGYPIEFSGNAYKDTNSIEVSNRGYITGAGTTKKGYLYAYQEARAEGYRTPGEKLNGYSSTKLTQENGKATFKNSAKAWLDTGYSPAISSIYMTQDVSNANGALDMTAYTRSAPSYTAAQNYDRASVSTSIKSRQCDYREYFYEGDRSDGSGVDSWWHP